MKKVLVLANNDAGLYNFRKEVMQALLKEYELYLSLPKGPFVPELVKMGCKVVDTPINRRGTNPVTDLKLLSNYKKMIKDIKPDIVLTYTIKPNVYGGMACEKMGIPYIANITGLGTAVENKGVLQTITLSLYKRAFKKVSCVFFQNEENEAFFKANKVFKGRHRLIPGSGVNLEKFSILQYPPEETLHFLFIARVMKEKGIDQYLEAAEFIKKKYPNTVFHILGMCEEAYEKKLEEMQNEGIIQYHGMQEDVIKFQKLSHCTIHPTYYPEGMSNVLLESAACGRPIITTNRSGCREVVEDGVNGYLIHPKNTPELIEKIETFIHLSYEDKVEMGKAGRRKVEKEFDRKIVVKAYMEEVKNALVNKSTI